MNHYISNAVKNKTVMSKHYCIFVMFTHIDYGK